jgi:beta-phosphoglucomutase-like phosphatase (HAD superfamily)
MIRAMIFDLDGTLVQTEKLKALSYAQAALELCPGDVSEDEVVAAFADVVGRSRREVAVFLMQRFGLGDAARALIPEFKVSTPWQAFVQLRVRHYAAMLDDPEVLRRNQWPHNVALLQEAQRTGCKTGLATMSACAQVGAVLETLDLADAFDFVASRDDVEHGKPDPEIYQLVAHQLAMPAGQCLVIEDSPSGVKAALAAGMWCIVVTTPLTRSAIHSERLIEDRWIVDDPGTLMDVVRRMVTERAAN